MPLCLERRGLVLVSNKERCGTLLQCTWITCVKNVSGPGVGELPGLACAPQSDGLSGAQPGWTQYRPLSCRHLTSQGLGRKPTAFVLPCSAALGVASPTPHSPDTYPHPPVTALQVGRSLRPPRIPYMEEDIIDGPRSSGRWQGLQTQPGHRRASWLRAHTLSSPRAFLLLWGSSYVNFMQTLFDYYRTYTAVGVEFEGIVP